MTRKNVRIASLALAAVLAASAAVAIPSAQSPARATGSTSPIQHIVVLMQENRSFDAGLGNFCDVTGRCEGVPPQVTLADGTVVTPSAEPDIAPAVLHNMASQQLATSNNWDQVSGCQASANFACIGYWTAASQPNLTALATAYGVESRAFTQRDSQSWGGHMNLVAATTDGFTGDNPGGGKLGGNGWGCDSGKVANWVTPSGGIMKIPSCVPYYPLGPDGGAFKPTPAVHVSTIMDEMAARAVPWDIYSPQSGQGGYAWATCPTFADCLDTSQASSFVPQSRFFTDAAAGNLPGVSFIIPSPPSSQHNGDSSAAGDNWIGKVASAVMNSPDWPSTALIITYDDCGCFYDQYTPPLAPDGYQEGPRVPFVVASPWAVPGFTDSTVTSSTGSILAFIEATFGLPALNANDAGAYNLSGMFSFGAAPRLAHPRMTAVPLTAAQQRGSPAAADDGT